MDQTSNRRVPTTLPTLVMLTIGYAIAMPLTVRHSRIGKKSFNIGYGSVFTGVMASSIIADQEPDILETTPRTRVIGASVTISTYYALLALSRRF